MNKAPFFVPAENQASPICKARAVICLLLRRGSSCSPSLVDRAMRQACSRQHLPVIHLRKKHSRLRTSRCLSAGTSSLRSASLPVQCNRGMLPRGHLPFSVELQKLFGILCTHIHKQASYNSTHSGHAQSFKHRRGRFRLIIFRSSI